MVFDTFHKSNIWYPSFSFIGISLIVLNIKLQLHSSTKYCIIRACSYYLLLSLKTKQNTLIELSSLHSYILMTCCRWLARSLIQQILTVFFSTFFSLSLLIPFLSVFWQIPSQTHLTNKSSCGFYICFGCYFWTILTSTCSAIVSKWIPEKEGNVP